MDFASLEPLEGGWSGETFLARVAGGDLQVVRIHARNPGRAEVDAALMRLVDSLVPVPQVLEVRPPEGDLPALLVTSYLPGERGDLVLARLGGDDLAVLGDHVGTLVATLGGMPWPRAAELVAVTDGGLVLRAFEGTTVDFVEAALAGPLARWSEDDAAGLLAVADEADIRLTTVGRRCLVHSDLNPKNLLVDPDTLEITGLVDWEYAHAGHPFTDLGNVLRFDRSPAYVDAVLAAYARLRGTPPGEALRLARAADLVALVDLAGRAGQNPVADRAEHLLLEIVRTGDLSAAPG
ncbi:phosphotransferase family protein [Nocardioides sp.]|uniref:phosphotransferase family protein n=1 Tax=Nocardioides sp. TaxID=35761 RepID=UPI002B272F3D|nr:phosphotransferase [Nocardioides sp.]